jgi:hypothetical protein
MKMIQSFLNDRSIKARLDGEYTHMLPVKCGTPQSSPWLPILYILYLAELLQQQPELRFGYTDDVLLIRINTRGNLQQNAEDIAQDVRDVLAWGEENKIFFTTDKTETQHFSRKKNQDNPDVKVSTTLTIKPVQPPAASQNGASRSPAIQCALRWLEVWFDRSLTFKRYIQERCARAEKVARHLRSLANTKNGPHAFLLRTAITTVVIPTALYAAECWYEGRTKLARGRVRQNHAVS